MCSSADKTLSHCCQVALRALPAETEPPCSERLWQKAGIVTPSPFLLEINISAAQELVRGKQEKNLSICCCCHHLWTPPSQLRLGGNIQPARATSPSTRAGRAGASTAIFWVKFSSLPYFQHSLHAQLATLPEQHPAHPFFWQLLEAGLEAVWSWELLFPESAEKPQALVGVCTFYQIHETSAVKS